MCIRIYFDFLKKIKKKQNKKTKKAKAAKEERRISVENLTGYDDIVCKFALCTFKLLDRVVNFSRLFIELNVVYVQREKSLYFLYYNNI